MDMNNRNDRELNEALLYSASFFIQSNRKIGKPSFLHSIRVSQLAQKMDYEKNVVISAVLHDLIEDTNCTIANIQIRWGNFIAEIVDSLTIKDNGLSKFEAFQESLERSVKVGKESLIVRVLDVIDNMDYFEKANEEDKKYLQNKYCYLFLICKKEIPKEKAFLHFEEKLMSLGFLDCLK